MATAWVTEFEDAVSIGNYLLPCGKLPAITTQTVTFTTAAAVANGFNARTKFIRIYTSVDARFLVGDTPVAVAGNAPITAKMPEFFGVEPGKKISFYDGSS
jgi:hypothetical protein